MSTQDWVHAAALDRSPLNRLLNGIQKNVRYFPSRYQKSAKAHQESITRGYISGEHGEKK